MNTGKATVVQRASHKPSPWPGWRPNEDLTRLEQEMCTRAAMGEAVHRGKDWFEPTEMVTWGRRRTVRADVLRYLLVSDEWPVDSRGVRLCGVRISGRLDLEAAKLRCPLQLDGCYLDAEESVCLDQAIAYTVSMTRCVLAGLTGDQLEARTLDLRGSILQGTLELRNADIGGDLHCGGAHLKSGDEDGVALLADGITVRGSVFLGDGFTADGVVQLLGAHIGGQLACRGALLSGTGEGGNSLIADRIKVGGSIFLGENDSGADRKLADNRPFTAEGAVRLVGADIGGQLVCRGALLGGREAGHGCALVATGAKIGGDVILDMCFTTTRGSVRLVGADIAGRLACTDAHLNGADGDGDALVASSLKAGTDVFLNDGFTASGAVMLAGADITGTLRCSGAKLNGHNQNGHALYARRMKVGSDVYLNEGFTADGAVRLTRADIIGTLRCTGARLTGNEKDRYALFARGVKVGGDVYLNDGFTADGAVELIGADITGTVRCGGAQLTGVNENGDALLANGIKVGGDVLLDNRFTASGPIRLLGADITRRLSCRTALLTGRDENGNALHGERMKVGGDVLFDEALITSGAVCLLGADVAGQLSCAGAWLTGRDDYGNALHGEGIKVGSDVCLDSGFIADGTISLASGHAGTLRWAPAGPIHGQVNLDGASVGELRDVWTRERANGYWPAGGGLRLDGFTYGRFGGDHQANVNQRLAWIRSQYQPKPTARPPETSAAPAAIPAPESTENFATQPYEQLAAIYRQAGQDSQARKVAIARRRDLRKYGTLTWYRRFGNRFLDTTIRYGYHAWRAGVALAALFVIFGWLCALAQQHHLMEPVGNTHGLHFVPSATRCTSSYPCFYPIGYAVDTVIPIINVHQADNWAPDGSTPDGEAFAVATWIATGLGWALATLLIAGYTGLVRQE